ncbi:hypothetical protein PFDG_05504 [Plasmodium falciparum Dd2]|uniref:Uncharacterized protein n=1 Tax=Plasmodium falciparum (isolate Dd2) TaxID=57267 RepID=A0A0L7M2Y3_PLAF4|nr:hypothetical protein PFDG_05504 [Plasmodium falciparum Dd2]
MRDDITEDEPWTKIWTGVNYQKLVVSAHTQKYIKFLNMEKVPINNNNYGILLIKNNNPK